MGAVEPVIQDHVAHSLPITRQRGDLIRPVDADGAVQVHLEAAEVELLE